MGNMLDWAKREIDIACKKENPNRKENEFDYGCACYESAFKAFKSLCEDEHSVFSIKMTRNILNRLIDGQPLTPIEDTDDIWTMSYFNDKNERVYQCDRMSTLFKIVGETVSYDDVGLCFCVDINDPGMTYHLGLVQEIINNMFPITMPYMPGKPIEVYCENFLTDRKNGDFDTVGIFYALKADNDKQQKIEINRFFREPEDNEEGDWTEISKEEYEERKAIKINN